MVKVWYEPPPYGPRTALNRPAYGHATDVGPKWVVRLSKMPPARAIVPFVTAFAFLASIPLCKYRMYFYMEQLVRCMFRVCSYYRTFTVPIFAK